MATSAFNQNRRRQRRAIRDAEKRRARRTGAQIRSGRWMSLRPNATYPRRTKCKGHEWILYRDRYVQPEAGEMECKHCGLVEYRP